MRGGFSSAAAARSRPSAGLGLPLRAPGRGRPRALREPAGPAHRARRQGFPVRRQHHEQHHQRGGHAPPGRGLADPGRPRAGGARDPAGRPAALGREPCLGLGERRGSRPHQSDLPPRGRHRAGHRPGRGHPLRRAGRHCVRKRRQGVCVALFAQRDRDRGHPRRPPEGARRADRRPCPGAPRPRGPRRAPLRDRLRVVEPERALALCLRRRFPAVQRRPARPAAARGRAAGDQHRHRSRRARPGSLRLRHRRRIAHRRRVPRGNAPLRTRGGRARPRLRIPYGCAKRGERPAGRRARRARQPHLPEPDRVRGLRRRGLRLRSRQRPVQPRAASARGCSGRQAGRHALRDRGERRRHHAGCDGGGLEPGLYRRRGHGRGAGRARRRRHSARRGAGFGFGGAGLRLPPTCSTPSATP